MISFSSTIIGWGKRRHNDDSGTNVLHEAEVPIISNEECKSVYYDYTITKNMFCAGHKKGRIDTVRNNQFRINRQINYCLISF